MRASGGFGRPHRHLRRTESTNEVAKRLAAGGAPHGTTVTADEQTSGRGRQGRSWEAPAGSGLLYSAVVRPLGRAHRLLPLAAGAAVAEAVEELAPVSVSLKWPNDVWLDGMKLAGILVEARPAEGWAVVGVGLNLAARPFPPELAGRAVALGHGVSPEAARVALDAALAGWVAAGEATVLAEVRSRDALRGRTVAWQGGDGTAAGIDDEGNLVVEGPSGRQILGAGEVHLGPGPARQPGS